MIPMFWLLLSVPLVMLADWLVLRFGQRSRASAGRWTRVAARIFAAVLAGALTWWLLDVPGFLMQAAALSSGDFEGALAAEPHPIVNLSGAGLLTLAAVEFLAMGVFASVWPERSQLLWGELDSIMIARTRTTRIVGLVMIAVAVLFGVFAVAALPVR